MDSDAGRSEVPAASPDETGESVRQIDRRALMLGAAVAGAGVATLVAGTPTASAQPVEYVRLGDVNIPSATTSIQTSTGIGFLGIQDNPSGLLASGLLAGVAGDSDTVDGVLGASSASNGVHGISSADGASGVLGDDTSTTGGFGVQGESTHGIGVLASSTTGTALKVNGPAQFTNSLSVGGQVTGASLAVNGQVTGASLATTGAISGGTLAVEGKLELGRSGIATVAAHRKSVKVSLAGVTSASLVIATLQGASGGLAVASVATRNDSFTIYLTGAPAKKSRIAWLVIN
jgi:hypothetical protein